MGHLLNKNLMAEFGTEQTEYCGHYFRKRVIWKTYSYGTYYYPVFWKQLAILSVSWRMLLYQEEKQEQEEQEGKLDGE